MVESFLFIFLTNSLLRNITLGVVGLVIGSFLNVVVYRLPIMLKRRWHEEANLHLNTQVPSPYEELNLIHPSSHCTSCKVKVPFWANIPILGYFIVNGSCHNCNTKISVRYPVIELITAMLFIVAGYASNDLLVLLSLLGFISLVLCLILIDFDHMLLPDELTLALLWLGLLTNIHGVLAGSLTSAVVGVMVGYLSLWMVYWGFKLITKRDGMGYGDFKFFAAILAWSGYPAFVLVLMVSSALGILYYIVMKLSGRLSSESGNSGYIPFGPFLGIAGLILVLGNKYINLALFQL